MRVIVLVVILHLVATLYAQELGQSCVLDDKQNGTCMLFGECPSARARLQPKICRFQGKYPIICCNSSISELKCRQWKIHDYEPISRGDSGGGVDALISEFPHMAALGFGQPDDKKWYCGGSLISEKFVLTAAHCLRHSVFGNVTYVRLGYLRLSPSNESSDHQDFEVIRRIKHPSYKSSLQYNDIALLELDRPARFNLFVHPACLQTTKLIKIEPDMTATGWGRLGPVGSYADHLQRVDLAESPHAYCKTFYNISRRLPEGIVDESQICADGDEQDTCEGDSGGPLQVKIDEYQTIYEIIGVTSFGKACLITRAPGVYTRVSHYVKWIESVVWPK